MTETAGRCGHVAVVGRANTGKSTLVNQLVGEKVAIVSSVPQTTRNIVLGIRNDPGVQLILVDTPGLHKPQHALNRRMLEETQGALSGVDAAILVVDASVKVGRGDEFAAERVRASGVPHVVALNKVDRVRPRERILPLISLFNDVEDNPPAAVVPISALVGTGVESLLEEVHRLLPEAPPVYPTDITTDQTERFLLAELIRERVLHATRQEIPHATAVLVESVEEKPRAEGRNVLVIAATLAIEKENQKAILIGRGGSMLKRIGTAARESIEEQLGVKCFLDLRVKVHSRWRDDRRVLDQIFSGTRALVAAELPEGDAGDGLVGSGGDGDEPGPDPASESAGENA